MATITADEELPMIPINWSTKEVECPVCGAAPGQDCHGSIGTKKDPFEHTFPMKTGHRERSALAAKVLVPPG